MSDASVPPALRVTAPLHITVARVVVPATVNVPDSVVAMFPVVLIDVLPGTFSVVGESVPPLSVPLKVTLVSEATAVSVAPFAPNLINLEFSIVVSPFKLIEPVKVGEANDGDGN